jgi:ribokinase
VSGRIPKLVIIGPVYVDMALRCQAFPTAGMKTEGASFSHTPSGPSVNRAIQASLCGCDVSVIAKVGEDCFGQLIRNNLSQYAIDTELIYPVAAMNTGVAITLVDPKGENCVYVCSGANRTLGRDEIEYAAAEQLIFTSDAVVLCGPLPQDAAIAAIRTAQIHKKRVVLDVCLPHHNPESLKDIDWPMEYYNVSVLIVRFGDFICVSELGAGGVAELKSVGTHLVGKGASCVVMTLGWRGALIIDRQGCRHIPGVELDVVDNSGAVDAFCGAFAACYTTNDFVDTAVRFAVAAEALTRSRFGVQDALPKNEEIIVLLQQQPD